MTVSKTPRMFAWAAWADHLKFDARCELKQGIRYLFKTGDSAYKPVRLRGQL